MHKPPNDRIWSLLARKLSGEASQPELDELEAYLQSNPEESYSIEALTAIWPVRPDTDPLETESHYKDMLRRMQQSGIDEGCFEEDQPLQPAPGNTPSSRKRGLWIMAALALLISAGSLIFYQRTATAVTEPVASNEVSTRYGSRSRLVLPDGSKVFLNAGSKLTYDRSFGNSNRQVTLSGEAFFDIVKNPAKPFIIHTREMDIRVIGTAFNVKCYPDEEKTEASLVRGSIEISLKGRSEKITLKPNEKLVLRSAITEGQSLRTTVPAKAIDLPEPILTIGHMTVLPKDSSIVETAWVDNKLVFRSERFDELAIKMERWYGVQIRFANESLRSKRFTGVFEKENISQALSALQMTTSFRFKQEKDQVIIDQ